MTFHKGHPYSRKNKNSVVLFLSATILVIGVLKVTNSLEKNTLLSPLASNDFSRTVYASEPGVGTWVEDFSAQFVPHHTSETTSLLHCLLNKESQHGKNTERGDGGLAIGPLQYHQATWNRMRKAMISDGLITEIGDPKDIKEAIRTTAWAIKESEKGKKARGSIYEWGPVLRATKGSDYAVCQPPSWIVRSK